MIAAILFVLGFLLTAGAFGTQVINGFDIMQYWLWFSAVFATIMSLLIIFVASVFGGTVLSQYGKFTGAAGGMIGGGIVGVLLSGFILLITYTKLWLSYYIIEHIPTDAENFAAFPQEAQHAIYGFIIIFFLGFFRPLVHSSKK